jgi:transposase
MRFYSKPHQHWCGIDLHAKTMYICMLDREGNVLVHQNLPSSPEAFLEAIAPYREDLVVAVECIFTWYWLADLCAKEGIPFVLGHALYMKAIHGGKAKNDRIDALKIATLLRGGLLPQAYAYPAGMRATRDLLRRRLHLVRKRGQLLAHIQMTSYQYNLPPLGKRIAYPSNREGAKMGNVHLKWAFSEAAVLFVRHSAQGKKLLARLEQRFGKGKALSVLAHKLGRAAYFMLAREKVFDMQRFAATAN